MRRIATLVAVVLTATVVPAVLTPQAASAARPNGAVQVADIEQSSGSGVDYITRFGDEALFQATNAAAGGELWITDGTTDGTRLLKDINPGPNGSNPQAFTVFGDIVLFLAYDDTAGGELWKTDGTPEGTVRVKDINPGTPNAFHFGSRDPELTVFGPMVLFRATSPDGDELWRTDGTSAGTTLIDLAPGTNSLGPADLTVFGNVVLFSGDADTVPGSGATGGELFKTDGSVAGTSVVKDIHPTQGSSISGITAFGGVVLFSANDGSGQFVWKSDGSGSGTALVKNVDVTTGGPPRFTVFGGKVLFTATTSVDGTEPWITDGTEAGTTMLKDIAGGTGVGSAPRDYAVFGGKALFFASDADAYEPWATDGTTSGTQQVKDICSGGGGSQMTPFTVFGSVALFGADDCVEGPELWATNGTGSGTYRVAEVNQVNTVGSYPYAITDFGTTALFVADNGSDGHELYRTVVRRAPGAPTIGTATAGNAQATVSFTPPASNGGSPITGYKVTSTPGGITKTGTSSPITVTGLTNGVTYTFKVQAQNAIGLGPSSAASNAVTPTGTAAKTITVTQPNGGESLARGASTLVKWAHTGNPGTTVKIVLLRNGAAVQTIASSQAIGSGGAGQRSWTPGTGLAAGGGYKIRIIVNGSSPVVADNSNTTFSLT